MYSIRRIEKRKLSVFVLIGEDEEFTGFVGLQHLFRRVYPVDRHLLNGDVGGCFGTNVNQCPPRLDAKYCPSHDIPRTKVVVVLVEESGEIFVSENQCL